MKINKLLTSAVLALFAVLPAPVDASSVKNTVGFTVGSTTGLGLTYRASYNNWFGQLAMMPLWNKEDGGRVFSGTQFGKRIQGDDSFYLNVAFGTGVMYAQGEDCVWTEGEDDDDPGLTVCEDYEDVYLAGGPSVGLGKVWGEHFHGEIYLPIAAVWKVGSGLDAVVPYPGATFGYRW